MKQAVKLLSIFLFSVFLISCSKDENTLDGFLSSLAFQPQKFSVNADSLIVITTARNSKIIFQPASFKDEQGNTISGNVEVFVKELFKKGDFIRNGRPTISYSFPLKSGGALMVKVFKNEREVFLDKPAQILLPGITGEPDPSMQVFYWKPVNSDSLLYQNPWLEDGTWILAPSNNSVDIVLDTINLAVNYYYSLVINELNWINCDAFYGLGQPMVELLVQSATPINFYNSRIFVVFQSINSVFPLFPQDFSNSSQLSQLVPPGISFRVLAIYKEGSSDLQYALTSLITMNSDSIVNIEFQPTTPTELISLIDNL